jgi:hypothetical protein
MFNPLTYVETKKFIIERARIVQMKKYGDMGYDANPLDQANGTRKNEKAHVVEVGESSNDSRTPAVKSGTNGAMKFNRYANMTCNKCKKVGHIAKNCWWNEQNPNNRLKEKGNANAAAEENSPKKSVSQLFIEKLKQNQDKSAKKKAPTANVMMVNQFIGKIMEKTEIDHELNDKKIMFCNILKQASRYPGLTLSSVNYLKELKERMKVENLF